MRSIIAGLLFLTVTGCAQKQIGELGYAERVQLAGDIRERCAKAGVKDGDPRFKDCFQAELEAESAGRAKSEQNRRAAALALMGAGGSISAGAAARRQVNCTTMRGYGGMTTTSCF